MVSQTLALTIMALHWGQLREVNQSLLGPCRSCVREEICQHVAVGAWEHYSV